MLSTVENIGTAAIALEFYKVSRGMLIKDDV